MSEIALTFRTPPTIVCRAGALGQLPMHAAGLGARILVVTDGGLARSPIVSGAIRTLEAAGIAVTLFSDVVADPPTAVVLAAADAARAHRATGIIGLGGGSSLDVAKLAAVLAGSADQTLEDMFGVEKVTGTRLPLLLAPTTAGTGSEVTPIAIVTTGAEQKMGVSSARLIPDVALLDAEATVGLPPAVTAATGIDAMVHAIEAYTSVNPANNVMSQLLAEKAIALLAANIRTAWSDGSNLAARSAMLYGAMLAGQAFANSPVAGVHALAYPIGSRFHIAHGVSNAVVLPAVMDYNRSHCAEGYAALAVHAFPRLSDLPAEQRIDGFIAGLRSIIADTQTPATLSQLGIGEAGLDQLALDAMAQSRLLVNNPRPISQADARSIYLASLG